eukprot:CAMPEP_0201739022 /NCGR_PEP_ID=MMETSP0593-20130828/45556_1 /ASSEMBLY_ACC=CAM_ASM_000672 /TAXON_ID=267983 /ORGANISM="Skeletonema japonicum, Strain CCMP2506" /LENGTH=267 /DNA_ID=CAMNT_0048233259 /DNA_START=26 /DNA_END=829 /DNA_ORIENTATION=+
MGRKRNQGKARKAAKAKAREEDEERMNETTINGRELALEAQTHWIQISDAKCMHGFHPLPSREISSQFAPEFFGSFHEARGSGNPLPTRLIAAHNATIVEYADVWKDSTKMEVAMSYCLSIGTNYILEDKYDHASRIATTARYFEEHIAVELKENQALFRWNKLCEAQNAERHTLVTFFRKRIPCSCLHEKYEEVKPISKMGMCFNTQCNLPNRRTKRSKTMYCVGCRRVTYCSRECQKAHWKEHKADCFKFAKIKADFDARQQNML